MAYILPPRVKIVLITALLSVPLLALPAQADVQDFYFTSFHGDYTLSRDAAHVGHLLVVEHLEAEFPGTDQNHGIIRALPQTYEGHNTHLQLDSVTDGQGNDLPYTTSSSNHNLELKIGSAGQFVHGAQSYVITYEQDHVTTKASGYDGHFWDVNGDQWPQTFGEVSATVNLSPELAAAHDIAHDRCFTGHHGSTAQDCGVSEGKSMVIITANKALQANETLTYEIGFAPGTFAAYKIPAHDLAVLLAKILFFLLLPVGLTLWLSLRRWWKYGRDPSGRGVIVPEYVPPTDMSVLTASAIVYEGFRTPAITATILDLAVRGFLKIYETKVDRPLLPDKHSYELEVTAALNGLGKDELRVLTMLYGHEPSEGDKLALDKMAKETYLQAEEIGKEVTQEATNDLYFRANPSQAPRPYYIAGGVLLAAAFFLKFQPLLSAGIAIAGLILLVVGRIMPARTAKGVAARDTLLGLKMYMQVAESERIKAMESPSGKLTEKIDVSDKTQLVKVYERLLPYAMIFGIEKAWIKEFSSLYTQPPSWYSGTGGFNAGYFAGSMAGFASVSSTSFSPPSSAAGGGSAGGGGGGGGGGGW